MSEGQRDSIIISKKIKVLDIKRYKNKSNFKLQVLCPIGTASRFGVLMRHAFIRDGSSICPIAICIRTKKDSVYQYASHELSNLPGLAENIDIIVSNLSDLLIKYNDEVEEEILHCSVKSSGLVTANQLKCENKNIEIINKDLALCTVDKGYKLDLLIIIKKNHKYVLANEQKIKPFIHYLNKDSVPFNNHHLIKMNSSHNVAKNVTYSINKTECYEILLMSIEIYASAQPIQDLVLGIVNYHINILMGIAGYDEEGSENASEKVIVCQYRAIESLGLNPVVLSIVKKNNINTIEALCDYTDQGIKILNGIGDSAYKNILTQLNKFGLKLKGEK